MLKLVDVCKAWQGFALKNITFEINDGEYFVLLGPIGAGKTLLLETIAGFHRLDSGKIFCGGHDVTTLPPEKRGFGYVPQNCLLFPNMTVRRNVEFGLRMRGQSEADRRSKVDETLALFALERLAYRMPATLSAGEKQKTALARILAIRPTLVLLDEPLGSIDASMRLELRDELKRVHHDFHVTIVHVTHDQMEAFSLAGRVAIIRNGQITQIGEPRHIVSDPKDEPTARLLGYENIYEAKLSQHLKGMSLVNVGTFAVKVNGAIDNESCKIGLRPEDVMISREPPNSNTLNAAKGVIVDYADLGPIITVDVNVGLRIRTIVTKRQYLEMQLGQSEHVWVSFAPEAVKVLE